MDTILIATDFSAAAKNATEYGVKLAKYFNANIVLVNAYPSPPPDYETGFSIEMINSLQRGADEALEEQKKQIEEKYKRDFNIQCVSQMGLPYTVITETAKKHHADLIVMGIVGEAGKLKEHLIGSSAVKVARHSEVPTFIIPQNVTYRPIHKIALACDLYKTEKSYLAYVTKYFAHVFDAELEIINIEKPEEEMSVGKSTSSIFLEKKLESIKHKTVYSTDKDVAHGLIAHFKTHPCDLVIVNPKKHSVFYNLFHESVTKELAFHLSIPILTIH